MKRRCSKSTRISSQKKKPAFPNTSSNYFEIIPADCISIIADLLTRPPFRDNPWRKTTRFDDQHYKDLLPEEQPLALETETYERHKGWLTPHSLRDLLAWRRMCTAFTDAYFLIVSKLNVSQQFRPGKWPSSPQDYLSFLKKFKNLQHLGIQFDMPREETTADLNVVWGEFFASLRNLEKITLVASSYPPCFYPSRLRGFCNPEMVFKICEEENLIQAAQPKQDDSVASTKSKNFFQRVTGLKFYQNSKSHPCFFVAQFPNLRSFSVHGSQIASNDLGEENNPSTLDQIFSPLSKLEKLKIPGNLIGFHPGVAHHLKNLKKLDLSGYHFDPNYLAHPFTHSFGKTLEEVFPHLETLILDDLEGIMEVQEEPLYKEIKKLVHHSKLKHLSIDDTDGIEFLPSSKCTDFFGCASSLVKLVGSRSELDHKLSTKSLKMCTSLQKLELTVDEDHWEKQIKILDQLFHNWSNFESYIFGLDLTILLTKMTMSMILQAWILVIPGSSLFSKK